MIQRTWPRAEGLFTFVFIKDFFSLKFFKLGTTVYIYSIISYLLISCNQSNQPQTKTANSKEDTTVLHNRTNLTFYGLYMTVDEFRKWYPEQASHPPGRKYKKLLFESYFPVGAPDGSPNLVAWPSVNSHQGHRDDSLFLHYGSKTQVSLGAKMFFETMQEETKTIHDALPANCITCVLYFVPQTDPHLHYFIYLIKNYTPGTMIDINLLDPAIGTTNPSPPYESPD